MQGYPEFFRVVVTSPEGLTVWRQFNSTTRQGLISGLLPNTNYSCRLNLTVTGGGSVQSRSAVFVTTMDGAPFGIQAPRLEPEGDSALRAFFLAPSNPNGAITSFFLYLDGAKVGSFSQLQMKSS